MEQIVILDGRRDKKIEIDVDKDCRVIDRIENIQKHSKTLMSHLSYKILGYINTNNNRK